MSTHKEEGRNAPVFYVILRELGNLKIRNGVSSFSYNRGDTLSIRPMGDQNDQWSEVQVTFGRWRFLKVDGNEKQGGSGRS